MANPAPTINQINAFNATQGTTIDFNIIGGTELVRSNRIYIYDLSDNSLICTHLYASTESIHELPPNTDGSIVYESGKSSADFVNGAQYYAQIQTFTDIAGTEGGSGLSVAKMFWCLVDPSLTIDTIPSSISTTSYNVSATYDANTSVVSNIIQQYQFNLYSATGSLLQSSGVIVGNGEQQGTSTAYDISYNFTGLSVGSSYYVVVDVTTTQGMSVSTQSNTFTVSIDTPTLGEATVVNNACDGYISVTSNLSGEYGGSASGEMASFETDSVNNVSSLKVNMDPIQDLHGYDKPWIGGAGKNILPNVVPDEYTDGSLVITVSYDGIINANVTGSGRVRLPLIDSFSLTTGFKMYIGGALKGTIQFYENDTYLDYWSLTGSDRVVSESELTNLRNHNITSIRIITDGSQTGTFVLRLMIVANSVTDYTYEPYSNICPISGRNEVDVEKTGKNLWGGEKMADDICRVVSTSAKGTDANGNYVTVVAGSAASNKNVKVGGFKENTRYTLILKYMKDSANSASNLMFSYTDGTYSYISAPSIEANVPITITATSLAGKTVKSITTVWASGITTIYYDETGLFEGVVADTSYIPYNGHTYTATLPQTVYGGTLDVVSGVLTVDRAMVDLGTLSFNKYGSDPIYYATIPNKANGNTNILSDKFFVDAVAISNMANGGMRGYSSNAVVYFRRNDCGTLAEWNAWLTNNPTQLCYELNTPIPFNIDPQQIQTLVGTNNVWSEQGDVELAYHIPITNLLVKRQDVDDVSGTWLTLHSQPITQASDMDFTFIDFLNQYGKTYKYALVPLLTQTQSGVEVEVEGGYTVSDEVQSIFDGVFISDSTGSHKCKANVGYGNVNMNQSVGSITPIGSQYPIIVTNSNNRYHNGSISGMIVPDDYYYNGNLSRIDMVNKRNALEQFLTNKRAKIIKDWNSNIWLVMIMDNIDCSFDNNYGMGMVTFNANWLEIGDPTNQEDLQATRLVDVGGV